jgi:ribonuclease-3
LKLGLDKIVEITIHSQSHNNNTYGNALEALIGAIYLDQGYDICRKIVEEKIILKHIDIKKLAQQEVNFKSRLIEWCQHHHIPYTFDIDDISTDEHKNPIFHARVLVADRQLGEGRGYTKKEAQQVAAQVALQFIKRQRNFAEELLNSLSNNQTKQE